MTILSARMRLTAIGTAAAALALALPGLAVANPWRVVAGEGGCGGTDTSCGSLAQAAGAAGDGHVIVVTPGDWSGADFPQGGLTIQGEGPGEARINGTLKFTGSDAGASHTFVLQRLVVRATAGHALHFDTDGLDRPKVVKLESSILSGAGSGVGSAAIAATTAAPSVHPITITARHVTVADAGSAHAYREVESTPDQVSAAFHDSIVQGSAPGADVSSKNNDTAPDAQQLFASPGAEDFHLRWNALAIGAGGARQDGESPSDVDVEGRDGGWDRGGDEFVNYAPGTPAITPSTTAAQTGERIDFLAAAGDRNASQGDAVVDYSWAFGDGGVASGPAGTASHAYARAGSYNATVRATDRLGAQSTSSVTITVKDPPPQETGTGPGSGNTLKSITQLPGFEAGASAARRGPDSSPPEISFAFPRPAQAVRLGPRSRPILRGRNADASGVRRVELALMRREGARCRWFDGRGAFRIGPCTSPVWFRAVVDDFDWYFAFPRRVRPRPGAYSALVRATDYVGNRTSAFTAANAVSFRWAR